MTAKKSIQILKEYIEIYNGDFSFYLQMLIFTKIIVTNLQQDPNSSIQEIKKFNIIFLSSTLQLNLLFSLLKIFVYLFYT